LQLQYNCKAYVNFVRGISSTASKVDYDRALQTFMDYLKKTDPGQLLVADSAEQLEDQIMDFIADQKEKRLSYATIRQRVAAIKHFYEMNRKPLSWKIITKTIGKPSSKKDRGYTHEEIRRMLDVSKLREQAAILLMSSAGLRIGAFHWKDDMGREHYLLLKHLIKMEKYGLYKIVVYEGSEEEYVTFCTPEAATAIDRYLEFRSILGEKLMSESPLLRIEFDKRDPNQIAHAEPLNAIGLRRALDEVLIASGVKNRIKLGNGDKAGAIRHETKIAHAMKKFAATNMVRAKVEATYREYLLSHKRGRREMKVDQLEMIYDRPEESDLLREYVKAIDFLTISYENKLQHQVEKLKADAADLDMMKKNYLDMKLMMDVKDKHIDILSDSINSLSDQLSKVTAELEIVKQQQQDLAKTS
jgi:site-specific recombinase XerD